MSIDRTTANFNLRVPNYDEPQWHVPVDENWDILDATLGLFVRVSNIRGPWKNATDYVAGDRVVDTLTGLLYETQTDHTSSSTGTFAEERADDDTLWDRIDQFDADPSAPSFTIEESDDIVPSVNGSIVNAIDSEIFGPNHAGWVGKGLYTRRTNETQAEYDARVLDPELPEASVYRYLGPEGYRSVQERTTGFTLTPSYIARLVEINAATAQDVTFNVGVLRDDQKSHVDGVSVYAWGDIYIDPDSEDVTLVAGTGVTLVWGNGQEDDVFPKGVVVRWQYKYAGEDTVVVYLNTGSGEDASSTVDGDDRTIQFRRDTAANFASANPVLAAGEPAFETDTGVLRIGDGSNYNDTDEYGTLLSAATQLFLVVNPTVASSETTIDDTFLSASAEVDGDTIEVTQRILGMIDTGDTSADFTANFSFGTTEGGETCIVEVPDDLTGTVTLRSADYGSGGLIDGAASRTMPASGMFTIRRLAGATKHYKTNIVDAPSFDGLVTFGGGIKAAAITGVSGTLTMEDHSGRTLLIDGDTTVLVEDGFSCRIISTGSHTVDAGGTGVALTSGQSIIVYTNGTTVWRSGVETLTTMPTS